MHSNRIMKKTIVFGIFLFLFIVSIYPTVGKTNNTNENENYFMINYTINSKGSLQIEDTAYIQGNFELDCWLYSILLNDPEHPTCVCPDYPGSGSGGTFTNDGVIITSEYSTGQLYEIDPLTCDWKIIGGGGVGLNGLAFNPIKNEIYGCTDADLYKIDRETGDQEYIGRFEGGITNMLGLACDADGVLYGWDAGDNLWTVNKMTGSATLVGSLGIDLNNAQDGDFHKDDDILYLTAYTSNQESYLYQCDEDTGDCTLVGQFRENTKVTLFAIPWNYPPSADFEWTPEDPEPGENILFDASSSTDPDDDIILYEWDWDNDGVYDESNPMPTTTHIFEELEVYPVTLQVIDDHSENDKKTQLVKVGNRPPEKPDIDGPPQGRIGGYLTFNVTPIDPDNDTVYIRWDWGDGDITGWDGPYNSGEVISENYIWYKRGTLIIKAQIKDEVDAESEWGELEVKIPREKMQQNLLLLRILERFPLIKQIISFLGWYDWLGNY